MVVDVIHAVAVITVASGTVAEFQFRVGNIGSAADSTLVTVGGLLFGLCFIMICPIGIGLLLFGKSSSSGLQKIRQDVEDVRTEEQKIVQQRCQRVEAVEQGIDKETVNQHGKIEPSQPFHLNGNDEHEQHLIFREHGGKGQQQAQIQCAAVGIDTQQQSGKIHDDHTGKIKQIKPKSAPSAFNGFADEIVEVQGNGKQQNVAVGGQQDVSQQPPDLSVENGSPIKAHEFIKPSAGIDSDKQVHNGCAQSDIEHEIGDALAVMAVAEPLEISS